MVSLEEPINNAVPSPGAIQAALHLDMPVYSFDRIRMYVEAINGQLPDIDLVSKTLTLQLLYNLHLHFVR